MLNLLLQGEVVYVLKRINLGAEEICSFVIGDACGDVYNPYHEWKVVFPPVPKPVVTPQVAPMVRICITKLVNRLCSQLHKIHNGIHLLK
jgi:sphingomyelin phosphodiesterase